MTGGVPSRGVEDHLAAAGSGEDPREISVRRSEGAAAVAAAWEEGEAEAASAAGSAAAPLPWGDVEAPPGAGPPT